MEETSTKPAQLHNVQIENENYFKISNIDAIRPFFMSIVSDSNHWMFISSNGGLSAGRKNAEFALFPYYTDDKITTSADDTGSKSIFCIQQKEQYHLWEPFSSRQVGLYQIQRNLYKSVFGNKIIFEEINQDLGLTFKYQWNSSNRFGFVRQSTLINNTEKEIEISILDGLQNIMPYGVNSDLQNQSSNLVDAYKRNELEPNTGVGMFALSAIIVDKAEPSEALKCNIAWSFGLVNRKHLVSSLQIDNFRKNIRLKTEVDIKAEKGAYFINADIRLHPKSQEEWTIIADVNKNYSAVIDIMELTKLDSSLASIVQADIDKGTAQLVALISSTDGLQLTSDKYRDARHFSNTLFNIMRGGIFDSNYQIEKWDFDDYLSKANGEVYQSSGHFLESLPTQFDVSELKERLFSAKDANLKRLSLEYMPLKFSRRHGDPSRPWNRFSINTQNENDGSKILDYEGNWRDIFQNWEALALSYPNFLESMILKFLNASTFDGYNPYRVTKSGIDWEEIEPDDPWSYIGYWGDHQIIYLLKLLELNEQHYPGRLASYFNEDLFVYANVPYKIKSYKEILKNPKDTIEFDAKENSRIRENMALNGADGALRTDHNGSIIYVNFIEKILAAVLAKISNLIPGGGIWMNTQRPEWNDANNALVGNGVSMVTLYYLRRYLCFFENLLIDSNVDEIKITSELFDFYSRILLALNEYRHYLSGTIVDNIRKLILDKLGEAGSSYRLAVYKHSYSGNRTSITLDSLSQFLKLSIEYLEHSIDSNKRKDHLYHAYNLMTVENESEISIARLSEMLEGQVAVLSSGYLSSPEVLALLDSLKTSALFREDQYSYLLYPNKDLPGFLQKNIIPEEKVNSSPLLSQLIKDNNKLIIERDVSHKFHFNGNFKNALDLEVGLEKLSNTKYASLAHKDKQLILNIFEEVFHHKAFTGRSGTFFGYEGLGSIYWHMVSKLQLAVQECCLKAIDKKESDEVVDRLIAHYYEINRGIGVHKPPSLYGAFPTDPYSHTPGGKGAQQPGMTGQVKEDILCRFGELGVTVQEGVLWFTPCLLQKNEFISESRLFNYVDVHSAQKQIRLEPSTLCFTYCQIPIIYKMAEANSIDIISDKNTSLKYDGSKLDLETSNRVFNRKGDISKIIVHIKSTNLR